MPLTAIVASKDRPAQLDLLLRSVTCHAEDLPDSIAVVWACSTTEYEQAYAICQKEHPDVDFCQEDDFRADIIWQVGQADDHVMFLTDDSYFYRDLPDVDPCAVLQDEREVICFSLRLGKNTSRCYSLKRWQRFPDFEDGGGYLVWEWATGEADFGYPGSMDGHVFRQKDLMNLIYDNNSQWWNPNTLEDAMCKGIYRLPRGHMASFEHSVLVGIPANRTSGSHQGNRYGEQYFVDPDWLNNNYLDGRRIKFPDTPRSWVTAAHMEMNLEIT